MPPSALPAPTALSLSDGLTDVEKTATQSYLEIRLEVQKSHIHTNLHSTYSPSSLKLHSICLPPNWFDSLHLYQIVWCTISFYVQCLLPAPRVQPSAAVAAVRERTGVEKVMGKMHFYVCERVKNRTNLHRPDGSRPSLWLGLSWPAAAWLLSGSRRQCGDTPPQHRQSTLLPPPPPAPLPAAVAACVHSVWFF